ncbi:hypothetical protein Gorai_021997, partial [Gossypium raimondii]|nr:hypothetical protein [Gossypium raimondii]
GNLEDNHGGWIIGFSHLLEKCSILEAELWGILDSLALVQEKQGKVLIQTDSLEAIKAIQDSVLTSSRSTLIKWIHHLLKNVED